MPSPLTFDGLRTLLPDLPEIRALLDEALVISEPDPEKTWSGTGTLSTLDGRLVDPIRLADRIPGVVDAAAERMKRLFDLAVRAAHARANGDARDVASVLIEGARLEEQSGQARSAAAWAAAAEAVARAAADGPTLALALRRRARAERSAGSLDAAREHYRAALDLARALDDPLGRIEAAIGGGNVEEQTGRWPQAEALYREALASLETLKPLGPTHWHAPLDLHIVLRSTGAIEESRPWLARARAVAEELGDGTAAPFLENAEGQLLMATDARASAERCFLAALATAKGPFAVATILLNLAEALLAQGRSLEAAEHAREAERRAIAGGAPAKLPEVYRMLGRIAAEEGDPDAFVLFERSLRLADEGGGLTLERANTLQAYARAEASSGRSDAALELSRRAWDLYRTLGTRGARRVWADCYDAPDGAAEGPGPFRVPGMGPPDQPPSP